MKSTYFSTEYVNMVSRAMDSLFLVFMATDAVPTVDTPWHSTNTGEAVDQHDPGSLLSSDVHYFSKHDTTKLSEHNFILWKHQLLLILEGYGLEWFFLSTALPPSPFLSRTDGQLVDNTAFIMHKKQDKFLASLFLSTVTDEILVHLTAAKTSFDIWTTIDRRFGAKSNIKISSMRHAVYSIKKTNLTIKDYLSKVKSLSDSLTVVGSLVTEQEQVSIILAGLPIEFESIRVLASTTPMSLELDTRVKVVADLVVELMVQVVGGPALNHSVNYVLLTYPLELHLPPCLLKPGTPILVQLTTSPRPWLVLPMLFLIQDIWTGRTLLEGHMHNGLYRFDFSQATSHKPDPAHSSGFHLLCNKVYQNVTNKLGAQYRSLSTKLSQLGIQHRITCPYTTEQNGVVERRHQHIVDMGLTLLARAPMPLEYWSATFSHAAHLVNRLPTPVFQNQTPYERLYKAQPNYSQLKKGYKCLTEDGHMFVSHHVLFDEAHLPFQAGFSLPTTLAPVRFLHQRSHVPMVALTSLPYPSSLHLLEVLPASASTQPPSIMRSSSSLPSLRDSSTMDSSPASGVPDAIHNGIFKPKFFSSTLEENEPSNIAEAFKNPAWTVVAQVEYGALIANNTWDLVPLPVGRRAVDCKWIFKVKRHADGSVARCKRGLIIQGYLQEVGIDFTKTFSPVVKPTTIRVVLAITVSLGWSLRQFVASKADNSLFIQRAGSQLLYVVVYVDDIIVTGTNSFGIDQFIKDHDVTFLSYFLGIEVTHTLNGVFLSQKKYILDLLQ
ncbi:Retrovirus-related Pol polyprotein from transposon TNT 1-94 [Gossypium australe]|uniref:Retrovirus-related Pol polyprotein from transposon TNT 1-94 n=1 Tax=Gossypium australe TaxID=47621 RepID=A0A5B6WL23_9ROSI|nr:Retrovirus-related Pol polyprotein from transposon TNT 1-94 [Gossypium australe]